MLNIFGLVTGILTGFLTGGCMEIIEKLTSKNDGLKPIYFDLKLYLLCVIYLGYWGNIEIFVSKIELYSI